MSVDSWDPEIAKQAGSYHLDIELIIQIADHSQGTEPCSSKNFFSDSDRQQHSLMMKQSRDAWFDIAAKLSSEQTLALIKFLTLAEMELSDWEAGEHSPVIYLVKYLRQQGTPIERDFLIWIKSNTDNRYLPNGPL